MILAFNPSDVQNCSLKEKSWMGKKKSNVGPSFPHNAQRFSKTYQEFGVLESDDRLFEGQ